MKYSNYFLIDMKTFINCCNDKEELVTVFDEIANNLKSEAEDITEVDKVTEIVVQEAATRLKGH